MPYRPPLQDELAGAPRSGSRISEYVLEELLGEGAFGRVWRARHAVLEDKVVAIKLLRDHDFVEFLRREGVLQHRLDHPGIVRVLGLDLDGDHPYLVEEFVDGEDLRKLLDREGKLSPRRALDIATRIAEVLAHAHAHGVVHRDLKPANVLLDREGGVHVVDFGLGKSLEQATSSRLRLSIGPAVSSLADLAAAGGSAVLGTWEYMAPEQKAAALSTAPEEVPEVDGRADLYALGILLYEMLTGARPAGRVSLVRVSPQLDAVFARCYTSIDERYPDASSLLADLERVAADKPLAIQPGRAPGGPPPARRPPLRPRALVETEAAGSERPSRLGRFLFLLPFLALPVTLVLWLAADSRPRPAAFVPSTEARSDVVRTTLDLGDDDEAVRLRALRGEIEGETGDIASAIDRLSAFIAGAREPVLVEQALAWKKALQGASEERSYGVRLGRFRIDRDAYAGQVYSWAEPGEPDLYIRVLRTRDGATEVVFDGSDRPLSGWQGKFPSPEGDSEEDSASHFEFAWRSGDALAIELWEQDLFGDNLLARDERSDPLAILVLCGSRLAPEGHVLEASSDFGLCRAE